MIYSLWVPNVIWIVLIVTFSHSVPASKENDSNRIINGRSLLSASSIDDNDKKTSVASMVGSDPTMLIMNRSSTKGKSKSTSASSSKRRVTKNGIRKSGNADEKASTTDFTNITIVEASASEIDQPVAVYIANDSTSLRIDHSNLSNAGMISVEKPLQGGALANESNTGVRTTSTVVANNTSAYPSSISQPEAAAVVDDGDGNNNSFTGFTGGARPEIASDGRKFYMYDLGEEFWWRWPVDGSDCSENGYVGHEHKEHSGIGPLVLPDDGLYLTWHFSLFSSLYNRMKRSSRRTLNPDEASLFIIPYDLGLDGYLDANYCRNRRKCSDGLVGKLTTMLKESKYFQRYNGGDHAVLWSLGQYHPWPRAGCDVFMKDFCERCTFTCYWMDATKPDNKFISVPFPSGYHWWDGIKNLPWDLKLAPSRNLTAVYLGSTQTLNPTHTKIRRAMTAQCNSSSECHWLQIGHTSKDSNIADFLSVYKRSVFCLCPPGDDPARKAVFDSIVSGCIPVIFELNTLYNQYPWHIGEQAALDISVYVPGGAVRSGQIDFMSVLLAITPDVIRKKQEALALIAPRVQYAMPPPSQLRDRYDSTPWDPPFKDGVELTLDGMFDRAGHVIRNEPTHIPPKLLSGREWGHEYNMVRVKVPGNVTVDSEGLSIQEQQDKDISRYMKRGRGAGGRGSKGGLKAGPKGGPKNGPRGGIKGGPKGGPIMGGMRSISGPAGKFGPGGSEGKVGPKGGAKGGPRGGNKGGPKGGPRSARGLGKTRAGSGGGMLPPGEEENMKAMGIWDNADGGNDGFDEAGYE